MNIVTLYIDFEPYTIKVASGERIGYPIAVVMSAG